jgi:hypothetical protein
MKHTQGPLVDGKCRVYDLRAKAKKYPAPMKMRRFLLKEFAVPMSVRIKAMSFQDSVDTTPVEGELGLPWLLGHADSWDAMGETTADEWLDAVECEVAGTDRFDNVAAARNSQIEPPSGNNWGYAIENHTSKGAVKVWKWLS